MDGRRSGRARYLREGVITSQIVSLDTISLAYLNQKLSEGKMILGRHPKRAGVASLVDLNILATPCIGTQLLIFLKFSELKKRSF